MGSPQSLLTDLICFDISDQKSGKTPFRLKMKDCVIPLCSSFVLGPLSLILQQFHYNASENHLFDSHHKQLIFAMHPPTNFSSVQTCFISLFHTPGEADSCSASQLGICIAGLFFIRSTFPSQKRRTLKSFKSHYG